MTFLEKLKAWVKTKWVRRVILTIFFVVPFVFSLMGYVVLSFLVYAWGATGWVFIKKDKERQRAIETHNALKGIPPKSPVVA